MAIGDQDHGRVAMPIAAMLAGAVHQPLDLALGEVAPLDCQVYDAWSAFLGCRFHADKLCLRASYCIGYTHFVHSRGRSGCMERITIAMQDGGAGAGARAASQPHFVLPPNLYNEPPGRGDFLVSNFHPGAIPGNLVRNDFWCWGGSGAVSGVACFGLPPWKKFLAA